MEIMQSELANSVYTEPLHKFITLFIIVNYLSFD